MGRWEPRRQGVVGGKAARNARGPLGQRPDGAGLVAVPQHPWPTGGACASGSTERRLRRGALLSWSTSSSCIGRQDTGTRVQAQEDAVTSQ